MSVISDSDEYRKEVNIMASSYYAWKNINKAAASSQDFVNALNANSWIWNISLHSLQVTFFLALGRIFDNDARSFTARMYVEKCRSNINEFTKAELEKRRLAENGGERPDYMADLLARAHEATAGDFDTLLTKVDAYHGIYEDKYKKIRHKFMAHKDYASINLQDSFFANTSLDDSEKIINFLDGVREFIFQLHQNGRLIVVEDHQMDLEKHFTKDAYNLLARLASTVR